MGKDSRGIEGRCRAIDQVLEDLTKGLEVLDAQFRAMDAKSQALHMIVTAQMADHDRLAARVAKLEQGHVELDNEDDGD